VSTLPVERFVPLVPISVEVDPETPASPVPFRLPALVPSLLGLPLRLALVPEPLDVLFPLALPDALVPDPLFPLTLPDALFPLVLPDALVPLFLFPLTLPDALFPLVLPDALLPLALPERLFPLMVPDALVPLTLPDVDDVVLPAIVAFDSIQLALCVSVPRIRQPVIVTRCAAARVDELERVDDVVPVVPPRVVSV